MRRSNHAPYAAQKAAWNAFFAEQFRRTQDAGAILEGLTMLPGAGELVLTGPAPTVAVPVLVTPGVGELVLTGPAPSMYMPVVMSPGVGELTLTGPAPTFSASSPVDLTWNSANSGAVTISNANHTATTISTQWGVARGNTTKGAGKWYGEIKPTSLSGTNLIVGVADLTVTGDPGTYLGNFASSCGMNGTTHYQSGACAAGTATFSSGPANAANDIYMIAFDADARKCWIGRNGTWWGGQDPAAGSNPCFTWTTNKSMTIACALYEHTSAVVIQNTLNYSPPSGFSQLG